MTNNTGTKDVLKVEKSQSHITTAVYLNNRACQLLYAGEDEGFALELFYGAIDHLKEYGKSRFLPSDPHNASVLAAAFRTTTLAREDTKATCNGLLSSFFDPLVLIDENNPVTQELFPIFAGCILLNMAVMCHKRGVHRFEETHSRQEFRSKAKHLYRLVYQTIVGDTPQLRDPTSVALNTIAMYNLADLSFQDDALDLTAKLVRYVKPLVIMQQQRQRHNAEHAGLLSGGDLQYMMLHLSFWMHQYPAAAA
jgi:hypothetical protein